MSIYKKNDTDLEMYCGDSGKLKINKIPTNKNYHVHLEVLRAKDGVIVLQKMVESGSQDSVLFEITPEDSNKFTVEDINTPETYYWSVKLCDPENNTEDTVIPKTTVDPETGTAVFSKPYKLLVRYKLVEGCENGTNG